MPKYIMKKWQVQYHSQFATGWQPVSLWREKYDECESIADVVKLFYRSPKSGVRRNTGTKVRVRRHGEFWQEFNSIREVEKTVNFVTCDRCGDCKTIPSTKTRETGRCNKCRAEVAEIKKKEGVLGTPQSKEINYIVYKVRGKSVNSFWDSVDVFKELAPSSNGQMQDFFEKHVEKSDKHAYPNGHYFVVTEKLAAQFTIKRVSNVRPGMQ